MCLAGMSLAACASEGEASGSVQPAVRELLSTPSETLVPLPDGRLIVEHDGRLAVLDPREPDREPVVVGPVSAIGAVHAALPDADAVLVLAEGGAFVLRGASWVPSPLGEALDGPIRGAARLPTVTGRGLGDLFLLTDASLYRVIGSRAERFVVEGELAGAQLAVTARPEGPALWLLLADRLLEVWRDRSGAVRTARLVLEVLPTAIAGDADGRGWMILEGRLHSFGADRRLRDRGVEADALLGSALSGELWAFGAETRMHGGGTMYAVEGVSFGAGEQRALAPDGSIFVSDGALVRRVSPRQDVRIEGPPDGALLASTRRFEVIAPGDPRVEAELDGEALDAVDASGLDLDLSVLEDGSHTLYVRVSYDDGTLPTEDRRSFEVVSDATWTEHVAPIYAEHCAACHGPSGPANTRLDAPEGWEGDLSEQILLNVTDGRMPLNRAPLTQREVALIEAWMINGFAR